MAIIFVLLTCVFLNASESFAQRRRVSPPRVEGQTVIGTVNGVPVTANDIIMTPGSDSPFMPPLDGSPVPILQRFETNYPTTNPTPQTPPTPTITPKPIAPSFSVQIQNMMKTGQEWLFKSLLDVIIKPAMPVLVLFAWIIASFILGVGFLRRFSENRGISPEQLTRWGIRSVIFMIVIGASPFIIDALTVTGKFIARPIKSFNVELVKEFDEKMKQYVKTNFAASDPNALLAERLPDGSPGLVAGAAINRQAENTQIQGIYNAEATSAKKGLEASNLSIEAHRVSSVAGVEGGLVTSLGETGISVF